jgi:hypothetical protein
MSEDAPSAHLIESTLYKEDVFVRKHKAVWGSCYDTATKRWGYACCREFVRDRECTVKEEPAPPAPPKPTPRFEGDVSSDDLSPESEQEKKENDPLDWSNPPTDLLPVGAAKPAARIEHFVRYVIGAWQRELDAGAGGFSDPPFGYLEREAFKQRDALPETKKAITPLIRRLQNGKTLDRGEEKFKGVSRETRTSMEGKYVKEKPVLQSFDTMVTSAVARDFKLAHETYMKMTFGNKMWNLTHVAHVAACTMKGAREYRRNRDSLNTYDMDPVSQKYMWALKKLVHFLQCIRPNKEDNSLNVPM